MVGFEMSFRVQEMGRVRSDSWKLKEKTSDLELFVITFLSDCNLHNIKSNKFFDT
jgi:hypothetical protein